MGVWTPPPMVKSVHFLFFYRFGFFGKKNLFDNFSGTYNQFENLNLKSHNLETLKPKKILIIEKSKSVLSKKQNM